MGGSPGLFPRIEVLNLVQLEEFSSDVEQDCHLLHSQRADGT